MNLKAAFIFFMQLTLNAAHTIGYNIKDNVTLVTGLGGR
jgi:hypothetical protein